MADFTLPRVRKAEGLHPTGIEWTDYSANPLRAVTREGKPGWACVKVSSGCANCYSESINLRFGTGLPFVAKAMPDVRVVLDEQRVAAMLAAKPRGPFRAPDGRPKVFIGDMTDVFGSWVPFETLDRLFAIFALRPDIDWQVLTKRPERMAEYLNENDGLTTPARVRESAMDYRRRHDLNLCWTFESWPLPNVWLGTSVEDQAAAGERIPHLLRCPAAVRFLSVEPLLGPVDLTEVPTRRAGASDSCRMRDMLHWVIVGGESGAKARACDVAHVESVRDQCAAAGVACFIKQLGSLCGYTNPRGDIVRRWGDVSVAPYEDGVRLLLNDRKGADPSEWPADLRVRQMPEVRRG